MTADLDLIVNGRRYSGWKSIRVTRSIETLAGSFALEVHDRWGGQDQPWPIAEEDACRVEIFGMPVIDGHIETRSPSFAAGQRSQSYAGKDRAAALVECSVIRDAWAFRNLTLADLATQLAEPFHIKVSVQPGLTLPRKTIVAHPGDSPFDVIKRAAQGASVLVVSDGLGGIVITRGGATRAATALIEGENLLSGSAELSSADRYRRYVVATQVGGTEEAAGELTRITAEAIDTEVRRPERVLMIRPEQGLGVADARKRADWEARIRAARAETATVGVLGWTQASGALWPLNALVFVSSPSLGVQGNMLISQIEHSIGDGGTVTQLRLVRPDAFTPEPKAEVKGTGAWKELAGGAH
ncbi:MAG TPA: hypothetical protein VFK02_06620 [Kofleriaceae bacterium]|nr:hypothetical protein [Kofleriaceae bacterium]